MTGEALTFSEIEAWCRLTETKLEPWEVEALHRLDKIRLRVSRET